MQRVLLTLARLRRDKQGATIVEFAILAPVMLMMLMAAMDLGHSVYTQAILEGEMQRAARKMTLESAGAVATQTALDNSVRRQVKGMVSNAVVTFSRTAFHDHRAAANLKEDFSDTNGDGICNNGESYSDLDGNGSWSATAGANGIGGAEDAVLYQATATYPRMFPIAGMLGWSNNVTVSASTILRNQPYASQANASKLTCI